MIVVSDTTPLISFLKINRLDLLRALFSRVVIPCAVYDELTANPRFEVEAEAIKKSDFIHIREVADKRSVQVLRKVALLDQGESEAIVLTEEIKAELLLLDEHRGREAAKRMGVKITGTIGIILEAFDRGLLETGDVLLCIDGLQRSKRRISESLFDLLSNRLNSYPEYIVSGASKNAATREESR